MSKLFPGRTPRRLVQEIVPFNPSWMDENGFLVNIPGPNLLSNFAFLKDGTNQVVGVYEHHYPEYGRDGLQVPSSIHADLLRFTISKQVIHQMLPNDQKAIIRFDRGIIQVFDGASRPIQIWKPYLVPKVTADLSQGVETKWLKCTTLGQKHIKLPDTAVPTTLGELFTELTERMVTTVRIMGYRKEMDEEIESASDGIFPWLYRLAQEDSDSRYSHVHGPEMTAWLDDAPDAEMHQIWIRIQQHCRTMCHKSREDRINRNLHGQWLEQLQAMILEVVAHRNARFPLAADVWSQQN